ncbi:MAG: hypothetical protein HKN43_05360 [Rhodothermales bacterium]|nr:hypothetical protein [Rhodothermales bacterium]
MNIWTLTPFLVAALLFAGSCSNSERQDSGNIVPVALEDTFDIPDDFGDYWYQGEAELTSYDLVQARYGELRDGHAVLIFVTEDFSRSRHVKLNNQGTAGSDAVKVLKLNLTKKFLTGIYPYSLMSSVFTPIYDGERVLKVTTSSQEWCGHSFSDIRRIGDGYDVTTLSYFEGESGTAKLDDVLLEDGIWTTLRLDPSSLPQGEFAMVPGQMFQRLAHIDSNPVAATGRIENRDEELARYILEYPSLQRTLTIDYSRSFPYTINGWVEQHQSGFGPNATDMTTTATVRERVKTDYWNRNSNADSEWRTRLGLNP